MKKTHGKQQIEQPSDDKKQRALDLIRYHAATGAEKEALKQKLFSGESGIEYPDVSKMSPEEIQDYPWKRQHWRMKAKQLGMKDPFDYGENSHNKQDMKGFVQWLEEKSKND